MARIYADPRWQRVRAFVLRRDSYRCHWCGGPGSQVDHLLSLHEGGQPFSPSNLVASCGPCNSSRGAHVQLAKRQGAFLGARRAPYPPSRMGVTLGSGAIYGAIREA